MKAKGLAYLFVVCGGGAASAGGLFLPGAGVVSTSRAGAAVASADDAEAIAINPAGIAKTSGTKITIGIVAIDYLMSFQRSGTYDPTKDATSYAGMPYPKITNAASPPLGIGAYQPVPVIGIVSDLNNVIPHLHAGFGVYAPNAYPFRNMNNVNGKPYFVKTDLGYDFPTFGAAPPPTRYDIIEQEAAIILPSLDLAYSITPDLDVGVRGSLGIAQLKSTVAIMGLLNYAEDVQQDGVFAVDASSIVETGGLGVNYRIGPNIELGANYSLPIMINAKGTAHAVNAPGVTLAGAPISIEPVDASMVRCQAGGTAAQLKACADIELPMTAQLGGRWKFLDGKGKLRGDLEVDLDWEHWGAKCDYTTDVTCQNPSDYHVTVDAQITTPASTNAQQLQPTLIQHGLQDTYGVRVGGSWTFDAGPTNSLVVRGGLAHDTRAAKSGWERSDLDGAARTMISAGGSYKLPRWSIDAGFGLILEGTRTNDRHCNPPDGNGCSGTGEAPVDGYNGTVPSREGPDPTVPIIPPGSQIEQPVNQGTYSSYYLLIMLGASTWF
ncbi:MAG: outer membrane protein transport protein [Kofleriaceae bacterium]